MNLFVIASLSIASTLSTVLSLQTVALALALSLTLTPTPVRSLSGRNWNRTRNWNSHRSVLSPLSLRMAHSPRIIVAGNEGRQDQNRERTTRDRCQSFGLKSMSSSLSSSSEWIVSSLDSCSDTHSHSDYEESIRTQSTTPTDIATATATAPDKPTNPTTNIVPTHLFLHFDINETILLGDDAGGDSRHESMHKMLAKSAFCRIPETETPGGNDDSNEISWDNTRALQPTHWWDGQEIGKETTVPKLYTGFQWPENCCPYYRTAYKKHAKSFVREGNHGRIYRPVLEACEAALAARAGSRARALKLTTTSTRESDNDEALLRARENTMLPAFYETLCHLIETSGHNSNSNDASHERNSNDNQSPTSRESSPSSSPSPPPFTVVFRTFGSDLPEIARVVTAFASGDHPDYPGVDFPPLCLPPDRLYQGRWKILDGEDEHDDNDNDNDNDATAVAARSSGAPPKPRVVYQLWNYHDETQLVASGDAEILELLGSNNNSGSGKEDANANANAAVFGIRDDYRFWKQHSWNPTAGKPVWVPGYSSKGGDLDPPGGGSTTTTTTYGHHLLFDDNIHNLPDDGIACVRREIEFESKPESGSSGRSDDKARFLFDSVRGSDLGDYQGLHLVRVPTVEPVLNPYWYIEQIRAAQERLQHRLQQSERTASSSSSEI